MKTILSLASSAYGFLVSSRHELYEKNILKSEKLPAKTISVGNISVGGTGKTPMVIFLAEFFAQKNEKICVLTRGYKRRKSFKMIIVSDGSKIETKAKLTGDEPLEIALSLRGIAKVIADANRVRAGLWAIENFQTTLFILDDAFQHFKIERDLDIVLIDSTNPFGNGKLLPAGILREPLTNLKRADAVVITRTNLTQKETIEKLKKQISHFCAEENIFVAENSALTPIPLTEFATGLFKKTAENSLSDLKKQKILAFCSIGNPTAFFHQLQVEGFNVVKNSVFRDHHFYTREDLIKLHEEAVSFGAEVFLTTAKDAVKIMNFQFKLPCFVTKTKILPEQRFKEFLNAFWIDQQDSAGFF
jgi:tetraacyldisaccharide 4'-kinase